MADPVSEAADSGSETEASLVLEQHFAIVPEWIIDAQISDCAYRLYSVLLRYGQTSGQRMPARATLAARLHKASKDTVDRALKELVGIGAVVVERRRRDGRNLTNRYLLMSTPPEERKARPRVSYRKPPNTVPLGPGSATCGWRAAGRSRRANTRFGWRIAQRRRRRIRGGAPGPVRYRRPSGAGEGLPGLTPRSRSADRALDREPAAAGHRPGDEGGWLAAAPDRPGAACPGRGSGHPQPDAAVASRPLVGHGRDRAAAG